MKRSLLQVSSKLVVISILAILLVPTLAHSQDFGSGPRKPDTTITKSTPLKPILIKNNKPLKKKKKKSARKSKQILNPSRDDKQLNKIKEEKMREKLKK